MVVKDITEFQQMLSNVSTALENFKAELQALLDLADATTNRIKQVSDAESMVKVREDELLRKENHLKDEITKLQNIKRMWDADLENRQAIVLTATNNITALDNTIVDKEARVKELEGIVDGIAEKDNNLRNLDKELTAKSAMIEEHLTMDKERKKSLDIREEKLLRREEQLQKSFGS